MIKVIIFDYYGVISVNGCIVTETADLIKQLSKKYKLVLLSNAGSGVVRKQLEVAGISKCFLHILLSVETGLTKPDESAYLDVINRLCVEARECLFVDDDATNVKVAEALGMEAVIVSSSLEDLEKIRELSLG